MKPHWHILKVGYFKLQLETLDMVNIFISFHTLRTKFKKLQEHTALSSTKMLTQHVWEFNDFCKVTKNQSSSSSYEGPAAARGFLRTRMTESPLRNILEMNLSLFTGLAFFLPELILSYGGATMSRKIKNEEEKLHFWLKSSPLPVFGSSVHISFTPSSTMLQCLWKFGVKFQV